MARRAFPAFALVALAATLAGCAGASSVVTRVRIASTPRCSDFVFPIYFAGRSADLTPAAMRVIDNAGAHTGGCRVDRVDVLGLVGFREPARPGLELPRQRAERVAAALAKAGLPEPSFQLSAAGDVGATAGVRTPLRNRVMVTIRFMR